MRNRLTTELGQIESRTVYMISFSSVRGEYVGDTYTVEILCDETQYIWMNIKRSEHPTTVIALSKELMTLHIWRATQAQRG